MSIDLIKSAPTNNSNHRIPIRFADMDAQYSNNETLVNLWDRICQPVIDDPVSHGCQDHRYPRADIGWIWPAKLPMYRILGNIRAQKIVGSTIVFDTPGGVFPAAMLLMAMDYHYLPDNSKRASFGWFLSVAPDSVYEYHRRQGKYLNSQTNVPKGLGEILIDALLVASFNQGHGGRMGLHADKYGGQELCDYYYKHIGLRQLDENKRFSYIRQNDGRYFYSDFKIAQRLINKNNKWR